MLNGLLVGSEGPPDVNQKTGKSQVSNFKL